jgi:hypothetical protein
VKVSAATALLALVLAAVPRVHAAADWAPNLTVIGAWNSNATNASASSDRIGAFVTTADFIAGTRYEIGRDDALHLTLHGNIEWWARYRDLLTAAGGARLEWRHKFGLGALAPVFSIEGSVDTVGSRLDGRGGTSSGFLFSLRKRFDDVWRGTVTQEFARQDARFAVYDRTGAETAIEVDREMSEVARLSFRASYRDGDVLSYGTPPRPDLVAVATNRRPVDTFDRPMVAYSIDARTIGLRASLTRAVDESSAVIFSYEWRETSRAPLRYLNQILSVAMVHQY